MSNGRLTYETELGISLDIKEDCPTMSICWNCDIPPSRCEYFDEAIKKLAEYENLEEQGLILRLPVAVGSKVYEIIEETVPKHHYYIAEYEVQDISAKAVMYYDDWCSFDCPNLYFSRAEAEEKLRKLEGK